MTEDNLADSNSALLKKIAHDLGEIRGEVREIRAVMATKEELREIRATMATKEGIRAVNARIDLVRREVDGLRTRAESHDEALRELREQMRDRRRPHAPTRPKRP
jgi:hypothetical protein